MQIPDSICEHTLDLNSILVPIIWHFVIFPN